MFMKSAFLLRSYARYCALACLLCCVVVYAHARRPPDLELKDLQGHAKRLSSLRGQIVVLSFWATWCGPCHEELPRLSQLRAAYAGRNVRFIAASIDEPKDRGKIGPFLSRDGLDLEVWTGADVEAMDRFGLGDIVPGTVILDEQGEIAGRIMGEARDEDIRLRVDWLLSGRVGAAPGALTKRY